MRARPRADTIAARRVVSDPSSSLRIALQKRLGNDQRDNRVAQELEALVGQAGRRLLVDVAAVNQRLRQQREVVEAEPQALGQVPRRRHALQYEGDC